MSRMSRETDEKAQKIHNPQAEFDKPSDVVEDPELSLAEKKKALENLEQDAHQLMTASNEGMAPESDHITRHEPKLDEVGRGPAEDRRKAATQARAIKDPSGAGGLGGSA